MGHIPSFLPPVFNINATGVTALPNLAPKAPLNMCLSLFVSNSSNTREKVVLFKNGYNYGNKECISIYGTKNNPVIGYSKLMYFIKNAAPLEISAIRVMTKMRDMDLKVINDTHNGRVFTKHIPLAPNRTRADFNSNIVDINEVFKIDSFTYVQFELDSKADVHLSFFMPYPAPVFDEKTFTEDEMYIEPYCTSDYVDMIVRKLKRQDFDERFYEYRKQKGKRNLFIDTNDFSFCFDAVKSILSFADENKEKQIKLVDWQAKHIIQSFFPYWDDFGFLSA